MSSKETQLSCLCQPHAQHRRKATVASASPKRPHIHFFRRLGLLLRTHPTPTRSVFYSYEWKKRVSLKLRCAMPMHLAHRRGVRRFPQRRTRTCWQFGCKNACPHRAFLACKYTLRRSLLTLLLGWSSCKVPHTLERKSHRVHLRLFLAGKCLVHSRNR